MAVWNTLTGGPAACVLGSVLCAMPGHMAEAQADLGELCGQEITIGVRAHAPPFSYALDAYPEDGPAICGMPPRLADLPDHAGYSIQLCRGFIEEIRGECAGNPPQVDYVEVNVADRYGQLVGDDPPFDLLCGATTATVSLRAQVPTSPYIFLTGTSALAGERFLTGQACKVGVITGTTSDPDAAGDGAPPTVPAPPDERRLPGWDRFANRHAACSAQALRAGEVVPFAKPADAISDLLAGGDGSADLLIGDRHILQWHLAHLDRLPGAIAGPDQTTEAFQDLDEAGVRAQQTRLSLLPDIFTIEPYAVVAPPGEGRLMAHFSRYLTRLQGEDRYRDLLRECFGRQVDRSFWFLVEFQSNVREGTFQLPPEDELPDPNGR